MKDGDFITYVCPECRISRVRKYKTGRQYGGLKLCKSCAKKNQPNLKNRRHGNCEGDLYHVWEAMWQRCTNQNTISFKYYGGRGIRVYDEWKDYAVFERWAMSHGYIPRVLQLDRKNNNGNYTPRNCRFVTPKVNSSNRRPRLQAST